MNRIKKARARKRCVKVMERYEAICRGNRTGDWDTIAAVGWCQDGMYGSLGETHDTFFDVHGRPPTETERDLLQDLLEDDLQPRFREQWRRENPGRHNPDHDPTEA